MNFALPTINKITMTKFKKNPIVAIIKTTIPAANPFPPPSTMNGERDTFRIDVSFIWLIVVKREIIK